MILKGKDKPNNIWHSNTGKKFTLYSICMYREISEVSTKSPSNEQNNAL